MPEKKSKLIEIKTKPTSQSVEDFINKIDDEQKRKDSFELLKMMKKATGEEPVLWSNSIIGFGIERYKSPKTGREVDWLRIGFSPRKTSLVLNLNKGIQENPSLLEKLGKYTTSVGCLYIKKLIDIDMLILQKLIAASVVKN